MGLRFMVAGVQFWVNSLSRTEVAISLDDFDSVLCTLSDSLTKRQGQNHRDGEKLEKIVKESTDEGEKEKEKRYLSHVSSLV